MPVIILWVNIADDGRHGRGAANLIVRIKLNTLNLFICQAHIHHIHTRASSLRSMDQFIIVVGARIREQNNLNE